MDQDSSSTDSAKIRKLIASRDEKAVANYLKSDLCKNVFVMAGAGLSTSAGIPDFRSPETGLYANLERLKLPFPEAVFEINFFRRNPLPFYTLAHELAPGRYRPTLGHSFIRLLFENGKLRKHFTQNIDTLERRSGLPDHMICEAHGSFANSSCVDCRMPYDQDMMKTMILEKSIPHCPHCKGLVKPNIVFFGESLPKSFHQSLPELRTADLLIIMGTSLTVHPFASLTELVPKHCPRVLINLEPAGDIGDRANDIELLGHCDEVVRRLCKELDWEEELDKLWDATATSLDEEYVKTQGSISEQKTRGTVDDTDSQQSSGTATQQTGSSLEETRDKTQKLAEKVKEAMTLENVGDTAKKADEKDDSPTSNVD